VVVLLIGGAVADRVPRQRVMVMANSANAASQGIFALLVLTGHPALWQMALLTAAGGTAQAFFSPASEGMVLSTVETAHAGKAFSVFRLSMNGASIGGAALGGALVAGVGPGWVLAADAAGFAVAARGSTSSRPDGRSRPAASCATCARDGGSSPPAPGCGASSRSSPSSTAW